MTLAPRQARLRALAKINLGLKVLNRRPDGYHELRTVFQTVSLADTIEVEFGPGRRTSITVSGNVEIPNNLVGRAARLVLEATRATGQLTVRLTKRIPVGAGLGGGSSDAAAILLGLPVLAGKVIPLPRLIELAGQLGSDVPFFLLGGRAVALGRGTELYPLPEDGAVRALLVVPEMEIPTAEAYAALGRTLTSPPPENMMSSFQSWVWQQLQASRSGVAFPAGENDFEPAVFARYPRLGALKRRLEKLGAKPAMLSGSGSALFGIFASLDDYRRARGAFPAERVFPVRLVRQARYQSMWRRQLAGHIRGSEWPPESRHAL